MINLKNKKGVIIGVANDASIAWGCAQILHEMGAQIAMTYLNDKARKFVEPLAIQVNCPIFTKLDVQDEADMHNLANIITQEWGKIDFIVHSIAFAPKDDIQGKLYESSREGFLTAMDISCHSLMRIIKLLKPNLNSGSSILTMSYYGAHKVIEHYNLMGPVKAALEASVMYCAKELGEDKIRINVISAGPVATRAASGLQDFSILMDKSLNQAPIHELVNIQQIGHLAGFLLSDKAQNITGQTIYIDSGYNIMG